MNRRMFFEFRPYLLFLTTMSKALGAPSSDPQASADRRAFSLNLNRLQKRHHQSSGLFEPDNETYASTGSINKYRGLILIIRHFCTPQGHLRLSTLPHHLPLRFCVLFSWLSLFVIYLDIRTISTIDSRPPPATRLSIEATWRKSNPSTIGDSCAKF